ncbi:SPOR domain-containing protein [Undibacterium sp. RTI2.1]|uniref:SPOR domain-containing protein n=1 Tax=unclassified Undibacterium TaxID=2630295 RepID=UPI002AB4ECD7|nr:MULTISPECIES: SPOR domain-containing protein [unclassified Undibacterium]MDY7539502.1 SPOR domain-containing protein [Undibacterium sp. 5I1]MEB0029582.1 SPOR domain-containing protein [Undibacterium sp. RTI2.1]MEB0116053.1 SPOR domain-containing protein [Undibacterium sp. RTI2.2]MEB0230760.1 SPOR domain-containing protein [Undibacterium sp. 10I3]MEB0258761.1 SPOR domain-containing protein [Undibacterium sp. 5I1]
MKSLSYHRYQTIKTVRQHGGTLLGLIVGLVIGLAIAVAVALLITKSSTPFTNKGAKAADIPVTQVQDPNKPMYGNKDAVKEAAKDFVKPVDAPKAPDAVANVSNVAATPGNAVGNKLPDAKVDSKPAEIAKPAIATQDKAEVKPADATRAGDTVDDKYVYYLQAGAFRDQADAESARAKLALIGFEARVSEKPSDNGTLYRVRIGPFNQIETMNRMRAKLSENSVDVAVVRTAK